MTTALIASDLDEVLGQFLKSFIAYYNRTHSTSFAFSDFNSYNFSTVLNRPHDEIQSVVYEYFQAPEFLEEYEPLPGATEGFQELREICDSNVHVVTARPAFVEAETQKFLASHFGLSSDALHIGNHHPVPNCTKPTRKKSEICQAIGAKVLIDDCLEYAIDCAENANIPVVLFDWNGSYGWNKTPEDFTLHPLITRVTSWSDVVDVVQAIVHEQPNM